MYLLVDDKLVNMTEYAAKSSPSNESINKIPPPPFPKKQNKPTHFSGISVLQSTNKILHKILPSSLLPPTKKEKEEKSIYIS